MRWFSLKKILINLFRISFYKLWKIINMINLAMLEKVCLVFFQVWFKKILWSKIREHSFELIKNTLERTFSDLWSLNFLKQTWRKKISVLLLYMWPEWFLTFLMIFQNWSQVAVICTRYLARPPSFLFQISTHRKT